MKSISSKRKFGNEVFTLRDPGRYAVTRKNANEVANFVKGLGKK